MRAIFALAFLIASSKEQFRRSNIRISLALKATARCCPI